MMMMMEIDGMAGVLQQYHHPCPVLVGLFCFAMD
jgi:hypothetical protein